MRNALLAAVLVVAASCTLANPSAPPSGTPSPALRCGGWLSLGTPGQAPGEETDAQIAAAAHLVDEADLLEGVRLGQHASPGTPRDDLIRSAAASLTKNCQAVGDRGWPIGDIARAMYGCFDRFTRVSCAPSPSP